MRGLTEELSLLCGVWHCHGVALVPINDIVLPIPGYVLLGRLVHIFGIFINYRWHNLGNTMYCSILHKISHFTWNFQKVENASIFPWSVKLIKLRNFIICINLGPLKEPHCQSVILLITFKHGFRAVWFASIHDTRPNGYF